MVQCTRKKSHTILLLNTIFTPRTDELIQETIKQRCQDCTVITIAHRLHTVMDLDRILVMDKGKLVEYDCPYLLLKKRGTFYNLVMETGEVVSSYLTNLVNRNIYKED